MFGQGLPGRDVWRFVRAASHIRGAEVVTWLERVPLGEGSRRGLGAALGTNGLFLNRWAPRAPAAEALGPPKPRR